MKKECQMSLYKNLTCKGTLRQVFYLSEPPFPSYDPILPPPFTPYTLYTCIQYTSHREGREGVRAKQREC
jgi:hypothetical protein